MPTNGEYVEPTISELVALMDAKPLQKDYSSGVASFVLPLSLNQYYAAFLADDAPFKWSQLL